MTGPYATESDAQKRAEVLKQGGTWPGVIRYPGGTASLTYDPQDTALTVQEDQ